MNLPILLNIVGLILGFLGAGLFWWLGRNEGGAAFGFYGGDPNLDKQIQTANKKHRNLKDWSMLLVAISFVFQLLSVLVTIHQK